MEKKLTLRQKIRALPFIGFALAWFYALAKLPQTRREHGLNIERLQIEIAELKNWRQWAETKLLELTEVDRSLASNLMPRVENLESLNLGNRLERYDMLEIGKRLMQLDQLQLARQIRSIQTMMRDQEIRDAKFGLQFSALKNSENVELFLNVQANASDYYPPEKKTETKQKNLDDFYVEFETLFRGEKADIKERLKVYLPYLKFIQAQNKQTRMKVIDVGCGRGEWLELLDEHGIPAMGVDLNAAMVDACTSVGLYAKCADAIQVLEDLPAGSIAGVTAFHLIEHLPFAQLIALFDAAKAALCEGGVIIFETPNPENLKVGACNFYLDPTHLNPIVPQVAEFMAKQRGFKHAEILRLHPYPERFCLPGNNEAEIVINRELYGPQDFALIAIK